MYSNKKRAVALLLLITMLMSLCGTPALAWEGTDPGTPASVEAKDKSYTLNNTMSLTDVDGSTVKAL